LNHYFLGFTMRKALHFEAAMKVYRVVWLALALTMAVAAVEPPRRALVSESLAQSLLIKKVDPTYPLSAQSATVQGVVVLHVLISKTGVVQYVVLVSGHPLLAPAALKAVKQWRYKPYISDNEPIDMETTVQVDFTLDDKAKPDSGYGIAVTVPRRVRVSPGAMQARLITKVSPVYPPEAKTQHVQGMVVLHVHVDRNGNVNKAETVSGPPMQVPSATEAVKQWKYRPFLLNQKPVDVESTVQVVFTLPGG